MDEIKNICEILENDVSWYLAKFKSNSILNTFVMS